jgi:hypothetical protein
MMKNIRRSTDVKLKIRANEATMVRIVSPGKIRNVSIKRNDEGVKFYADSLEARYNGRS